MNSFNFSSFFIYFFFFVISIGDSVQAYAGQGRRELFELRRRTELLAKSPGDSRGGREPWNFFRFVQQSSQFIRPPPLFPFSSLSRDSQKRYFPGDSLNEILFAPLDDVVMGGASASTYDSRSRLWKGYVTDVNNGGFLGIRSKPFAQTLDLSQCQGVVFKLRLREPSRSKLRFKVGVRDSTDFNGLVWNASFDLQGNDKVETVRIPFSKLMPNRFASRVPVTKPLQTDRIAALQLVYSKFEYDGDLNPNFLLGNIEVVVEYVGVY